MTRGRRRLVLLLLLPVAAGATGLCWLWHPEASPLPEYGDAGRPPRIDPDYGGCTIPANIAPLNFAIKEPGTRYCAHVYAEPGQGFVVTSGTPAIALPAGKWRDLLEQNRGKTIAIDVYVRGEERRWQRFDALTNTVAEEDIDPYVVYRRLKPLHNAYTEMGTYQRNLGGFDETPILVSGRDSGRCVNCHAFAANSPDKMVLHIRGAQGNAMLLSHGDAVSRVDTSTRFNAAPVSYPAWHPSGRIVAFSINNPMLLHHTVGDSRDVFDYSSDLVIYDVDSRRLAAAPQIADPDRLETFPAWSPDGRYLYFCSAPKSWMADTKGKLLPTDFQQVRYDLQRASYDIDRDTWGPVETLLSASDTGRSMSEPRISPDGRFLLFCMHQYGAFPVYQQSSDLYLMDLQSRRHWPLDCNSPRSESWHCWSSNGRWIVFASKRRDGLFGRLYFSHVDQDGKAGKPFLLPAENPTFYDSCLHNYNAPELITGPVTVGQRALVDAILCGEEERATFSGAHPAVALLPAYSDADEPALAALRKAVEADPTAPGPFFRLGLALEEREHAEQAAACYRRAIEFAADTDPLKPHALNDLAWMLATCPDAGVRDGKQALLLAQRAIQSAGKETPLRLDTLAAAYAELGDFSKAREIARRAESLAIAAGQTDLAGRIRGRFEQYLAGRPHRKGKGANR